MRRLNVLAIAGLAATLIAGPPPVGSPAKPKCFTSLRWGFSMDPPLGWRCGAWGDQDLPAFVNMPWSRFSTLPYALPPGGAMIHVVTEANMSGRHRSYTLEQWADFDARVSAVSGTVERRVIEMPSESQISTAIFVAFDEKTFSSSEQRQHSITIYWQLGAVRFASYLDCTASDPRANGYGDLLISAMRSVRPLPATAK
jgi:hypothetical protein